ncbi:MAG: two-component regulator propeller domain-containing protein [Myxococcota bacterium]
MKNFRGSPRWAVWVGVWGLAVPAVAAPPAERFVPDPHPERFVVDATERARAARFELERWSVEDGLPQSSVTDLTQSTDGYLYLSTFGGVARFDGSRFTRVSPARVAGLRSIRFTAIEAAADGDVWVGLQDGGLARLRGLDGAALPDPGEPPLGVIRELLAADDDLWIAADAGLVRYRPADGSWTRFPGDYGSLALVDGVVWAGGHGLVRIDGDQAVPVPLAVEGDIGELVPDPGAGLWIATTRGIVAPSGRVLGLGERENPKLAIDPAGRVWLGSRLGLELVGDRAALAALDGGPIDPVARWDALGAVRQLTVDREGHLWVGTDADGLLRVSPLPFERTRPPGHTAAIRVLTPAPGTADQMLIAPVCDGLYAVDAGGWRPVIDRGCVYALVEDPPGEVTVGLADTLVRLGDPRRPRVPIATFARDVIALARAPDGAVWIGTDGAGAHVLRDGVVTPVDGISRWAVIQAIAVAPDGAVWLGRTDGVDIVRDGALEHLGAPEGLPAAQVRAIAIDGDGTAWLGTYGGGLVRIAGRTVTVFTEDDGLPDDVVSAILDDGRGTLWFNGNRGVWRIARAELDAVAAGTATEVRALLFRTGEGNGGATPSGALSPSGETLWFPTIDGAVAVSVGELARNDVPPIPLIEEVTVDDVPYSISGGWSAPAGPRDLVVRFTAAVLGAPRLARFEYRLVPFDTDWRPATAGRLVRYAHLGPGRYTFEVRAANEDAVWSAEPARVAIHLRPYMVETGWFRALVLAVIAAIVFGTTRLVTQAQRTRNAALQTEILHRQRIEDALRSSEAHYRSVFHAASDGLLVVDRAGVVTDANPAAMTQFGAILGRRADELVRTDTTDRHRAIRADGTTFPARVSTVALGDGRSLWSIVDLTPLVELRDRLARAQRLEAVGRLAGGVAHDFNNLLTVARANAASLRTAVRALRDPAAIESIDLIESVARRGAQLTSQLLAFGQRQLLRPEPTDLADLVRRTEPMLRRMIRTDIAFELVIAPTRTVVGVDPGQTELALVNLVLNAVDAMPDGGKVDVSVVRVAGRDAAERWGGVPDDRDWIVLTVADTGVPLDEDLIEHLFEPFVTVDGGRSTGLGLAAVHGFVTQSHGFVFVRAGRPRGTTFDLLLPAVTAEPTPRPVERPTPAESGSATILVCDDDPMVRRTLERLLRTGGFAVVGADGPARALEILAERPVDLLVTDVLMPEMTGVELARRARERHPSLQVAFVSGYTRELLPENIDGPLVSKPFDPATLLDVVRSALIR